MLRRFVAPLMVFVTLTMGNAPISSAGDTSSLIKDLVTAPDFRVRVAAAFAIGKSGNSAASRSALENALSDSNASVRAAAATSLATMGDAAAVSALEAAANKEGTASVKTAMQNAAKKLSASKPSSKAKYLVALGSLENKSGVSGAQVTSMLKSSARSRVAQIANVEMVAEGGDAGALSKSRGLPAFALDGKLTHLSKTEEGREVGYTAKVEFVVRKVPEQALKGTIRGNAKALVTAGPSASATELAKLQIEAVTAAVDSALRGASPVLEAGAK